MGILIGCLVGAAYGSLCVRYTEDRASCWKMLLAGICFFVWGCVVGSGVLQ